MIGMIVACIGKLDLYCYIFILYVYTVYDRCMIISTEVVAKPEGRKP